MRRGREEVLLEEGTEGEERSSGKEAVFWRRWRPILGRSNRLAAAY